jgi:hypothetical protein
LQSYGLGWSGLRCLKISKNKNIWTVLFYV